MKAIPPSRLRPSILILALVVVLIVTSNTKEPRTTFNVECTTELITIDSISFSSSNYVFYDALIYNEADLLEEHFNGEFEPNQGISVKFERVSSGPLIIEFKSNTSDGQVGKLIDFETQSTIRTLKSGSAIVVNNYDSLLNLGHPYIFPYTGKVKLGKKIANNIAGELPAVLKSGTVIISSQTIFSGKRFRAKNLDLQAGDYITFTGDNYAYGFVSLDESPRLTTSFRILSDTAIVRKAGPEDIESGYTLSTSLYARISNDSIYQMATAIGALIAFSITLLRLILSLRELKKKNPNEVQ